MANAHFWSARLAATPGTILVQPYGFGNSGWLGWSAVALVEAIDDIRSRFGWIADAISIFGSSSGATGALQLAGLLPSLVDSVVAVNPWADPALDSKSAMNAFKPWELQTALQLAPATLCRQMQVGEAFLELKGHSTGIAGSADPRHAHRLAALFRRMKQPCKLRVSNALFRDTARFTNFPDEVWQALHPHRSAKVGRSLCRVTGSDRLGLVHPYSIRDFRRPGPARIEMRFHQRECRIKSDRVSALEISADALPPEIESIDLDGQSIGGPTPGAALCFERLGARWRSSFPSEPSGNEPLAALRAGLAARGPMFELFFRAPTIVFGTLGDDRQNAILHRFAANLQRRMEDGTDSINLHPGDHRTTMKLRVASDADAIERLPSEIDLVLIGTPRTNLLLARLQGRLNVNWIPAADASLAGGMEPFSIAGRSYANPRDLVIFIQPHPDHPGRVAAVISAVSVDALSDAANIRLAFLPDVATFRESAVDRWGWWDSAGRPVWVRASR